MVHPVAAQNASNLPNQFQVSIAEMRNFSHLLEYIIKSNKPLKMK